MRGKLIGIEGKYYVVMGADGKELRLLVSQDTELAGEFRPGDPIEVFTSPGNHAVAIKTVQYRWQAIRPSQLFVPDRRPNRFRLRE